MKYDTIIFTNVSDETFVGIFNSEQYPIKAGEVRYFPDFLATHFAEQLAKKISYDAYINNKKIKIEVYKNELKEKILGKTLLTKTEEQPKTQRQESGEHELAVREMLNKKSIEERKKVIEAEKITKDYVG